MKNKKTLYFLLSAAILIWGLVFYRIFSAVISENSTNLPLENISVDIEKTTLDTFSIYADYNDPFLKKNWSFIDEVKLESNKSQKKNKETIEKQQQIINWPKISYGGLVKNQKSNKQVVLLTIDGNSHLMNAGETISGISLIKVFTDSIEVLFEKDKRFIKK